MQTALQRAEEVKKEEVRALFEGLKQAAEEYFRTDANMANAEITYEGRIDLRYLGQEHSVTVPVEITAATVEEILADFHDAHEKTYTFRLDDTPVEFVTYRLAASANVPRPELKKLTSDGRSLEAARKDTRIVDFSEDGQHEAAVYERDKLPAGAMLEGPLIVEEATSTTLVHPGQHLWVDEFGFLHIANA
jgi:N-methylhydantoinase A